MEPDRTVLTEAMWQRIESILPGKAGDPGVTAADNRQFLEAVLWRRRTGASWRHLPEHFGKWNSVFKRYRRWEKSGVFERVSGVLSEEFGLEHMFIDSTVVDARRIADAKDQPADSELAGPVAD